MIIALAYCDKDIDQALRWMQWAAFLTTKADHEPPLPIWLFPSKWATTRRRHAEIVRLGIVTFPDLRQFMPPGDCEQGWPASPNFMFKSALEFMAGEDMLWMEPDAVPVDPCWAKVFVREWDEAQSRGKHFMGSLSKFGTPHMTGIGVYGARWREFAPELANVPNHEPFDSYGGKAVLGHAWITGLIQHRGTDKPVESVAKLEDDAVIYHPDKDGRLIAMMDKHMFNGECDLIYGYSKTEQIPMAQHFYHAENTNRAVRAGNLRFVFESYSNMAGAWQGVYATENATEIEVLDQLAASTKSSVRVSTKEEYEAATQKKMPAQSHAPFPVRKEIPIQGAGAVEVAGKPHDTEAEIETQPDVVADKIEDILVIGQVTPPKPEEPPRPRGRPRKPVFGSTDVASNVG